MYYRKRIPFKKAVDNSQNMVNFGQVAMNKQVMIASFLLTLHKF